MNETPKRANFQQVENSVFTIFHVLVNSFIFLAFGCSILTLSSFIVLSEELFSRVSCLAASPFFPTNQSIAKQNLLFTAISVFFRYLFLILGFVYLYTIFSPRFSPSKISFSERFLPPIIHLICPLRCVLNISWDDCYTQEKLKTKVLQNLGGKQVAPGPIFF